MYGISTFPTMHGLEKILKVFSFALFCTVHAKSYDDSLELRRFNGQRWIKVHELSITTRTICKWATMHNLWWTPVHWFKEEDKNVYAQFRQDAYFTELSKLMKHERKHKKSGSGIRLDKENFYANKSITDYECRKNTMHDFQRVYN